MSTQNAPGRRGSTGFRSQLVVSFVVIGIAPLLILSWLGLILVGDDGPSGGSTPLGLGLGFVVMLTGVAWYWSGFVARPYQRLADRLSERLALDSERGELVARAEHTASNLTRSAAELADLGGDIADTVQATARQANDVATLTGEISTTSESVARAMDQMSASVLEISENTSEAARVSTQAVDVSVATRQRMQALEASASDIGNVVSVITSIAEQTDLLALNATIEAARVGDAGKGFAVVANEVKALASQTSAATEEIQDKIEAIQNDSIAAVRSIADISDLIEQVNEASTTIAGAVEEQSVTSQEITAMLQAVTGGTADVSTSIADVATAAGRATVGVEASKAAATRLADLARELDRVLEHHRLAESHGGRHLAGLDPAPSGSGIARPAGSAAADVAVPASPVTGPNAASDTSPTDIGVGPVSSMLEAGRDRADGDGVGGGREISTVGDPGPDGGLPPETAAAPAAGGVRVGRLEELDSDLLDSGWH